MENHRNKVGFTLFIILLFVFGVGGYVAMKYYTTPKEERKTYFQSSPKETDKRIDKTKDYVYYDGENVVLGDLDIGYKNIIINLSSGKVISETLNKETQELKNTIKYVKDVTIPKDTEYEENEQGIYSLDYRDYVEYDYENYITVLVKDSSYDVVNGSVPKSIKAYVLDKNKDILLSENDLLNIYGTSIETIKEKVKTKLSAEQETVDEEPLYNIDNTLNSFKYALTINKIGKLEINYIVSSTKTDFYDKIVIE